MTPTRQKPNISPLLIDTNHKIWSNPNALDLSVAKEVRNMPVQSSTSVIYGSGRIIRSLTVVSRMVLLMLLMISCRSNAATLMTSSDEPIVGKTQLSFEQIAEFILETNPNFDPEIARHYVNIGNKYGIRAEIAISQAILETGWFEFKHSATVKPDHHNYCGLGVTSNTASGCRFDRVDDGVTAHIQHLFAYATDKPLPNGETLIDPRFRYVKRACATSISGLTGTWAMSNQYAKRILDIYNRMQEYVRNKNNAAK